jgi:hypothetical protein
MQVAKLLANRRDVQLAAQKGFGPQPPLAAGPGPGAEAPSFVRKLVCIMFLATVVNLARFLSRDRAPTMYFRPGGGVLARVWVWLGIWLNFRLRHQKRARLTLARAVGGVQSGQGSSGWRRGRIETRQCHSRPDATPAVRPRTASTSGLESTVMRRGVTRCRLHCGQVH